MWFGRTLAAVCALVLLSRHSYASASAEQVKGTKPNPLKNIDGSPWGAAVKQQDGTRMTSPITVVITGAAGRIAYALIPIIASGAVFGKSTRMSLRLLDVSFAAEKLEGVAMEIEDCNYALVDDVKATLSSEEAFQGADVAILLGGFPRLAGMERKDLITKNAEGMREQGQAIERFAKKTIKVCVVANPANTNCLVAMKCAPSIPAENFSCLTRLDEERLRGFVLQRARQKGLAGISADDVEELCIWGNHSASQVPYIDAGRIRQQDGTDIAVSSLFPTQADCDELISRVQNRGAAIIQKQQASSGLSAANAIANHLIDWIGPPRHSTTNNKVFSMGILSTGNPYGVPDGLVYSFPLRRSSASGAVEIVGGASISPKVQAMLDATAKELLSEKADAETLVGDLSVKGAAASSKL